MFLLLLPSTRALTWYPISGASERDRHEPKSRLLFTKPHIKTNIRQVELEGYRQGSSGVAGVSEKGSSFRDFFHQSTCHHCQ